MIGCLTPAVDEICFKCCAVVARRWHLACSPITSGQGAIAGLQRMVGPITLVNVRGWHSDWRLTVFEHW